MCRVPLLLLFTACNHPSSDAVPTAEAPAAAPALDDAARIVAMARACVPEGVELTYLSLVPTSASVWSVSYRPTGDAITTLRIDPVAGTCDDRVVEPLPYEASLSLGAMVDLCWDAARTSRGPDHRLLRPPTVALDATGARPPSLHFPELEPRTLPSGVDMVVSVRERTCRPTLMD